MLIYLYNYRFCGEKTTPYPKVLYYESAMQLVPNKRYLLYYVPYSHLKWIWVYMIIMWLDSMWYLVLYYLYYLRFTIIYLVFITLQDINLKYCVAIIHPFTGVLIITITVVFSSLVTKDVNQLLWVNIIIFIFIKINLSYVRTCMSYRV